MLNIALISYVHISKNHFEAIAQQPDANCVPCCDIIPKRTQTAVDIYDIPFHTDDYATMRARDDVNDELIQRRELLKDKGVPSMIYYLRGMHQQSVFKDIVDICDYEPDEFSNTRDGCQRRLVLPVHEYMGADWVNCVVVAVKRHVAGK